MGCDIAYHKPPPDYCKPRCKEFKLVTMLDKVEAQCVRCTLLHEYTVDANGKGKVHFEKKARK